ncbi:MAG: hypothetical protein OEX11_08810, partial [Nitrosomonas sp.]|nr:hypothetical protein [Nitrosomonas sp.]
MKSRNYYITLLIAFLVLPDYIQAELDERQLLLQREYAHVLRWDNVEGSPQWVAGELPQYHFQYGLHFVKLKPGQSTTVRLPQAAFLRLYHPSQLLSPDDVTVSHSNGSGLFASLPVAVSADASSLITQVDRSRNALLQVTRPTTHQEEIVLALFISRLESVGEIAPYRNVIPLTRSTVQLRRSDHAAGQTYWEWLPEN